MSALGGLALVVGMIAIAVAFYIYSLVGNLEAAQKTSATAIADLQSKPESTSGVGEITFTNGFRIDGSTSGALVIGTAEGGPAAYISSSGDVFADRHLVANSSNYGIVFGYGFGGSRTGGTASDSAFLWNYADSFGIYKGDGNTLNVVPGSMPAPPAYP